MADDPAPWWKQGYQRPTNTHLGAHASGHVLEGELTPRTRLARHFEGQDGVRMGGPHDLVASTALSQSAGRRGGRGRSGTNDVALTDGAQLTAHGGAKEAATGAVDDSGSSVSVSNGGRMGAGLGKSKKGAGGKKKGLTISTSTSQAGSSDSTAAARSWATSGAGGILGAVVAGTIGGDGGLPLKVATPGSGGTVASKLSGGAASSKDNAYASKSGTPSWNSVGVFASKLESDVSVAATAVAEADGTGSLYSSPGGTDSGLESARSVIGSSRSMADIASPPSSRSSGKRRRIEDLGPVSVLSDSHSDTPPSSTRQHVFSNCGGMRQMSPRTPTNPFAVCSSKGRRRTNEDRFSVVSNVNNDPRCAYYAVFDGHGGTRAADYAALHLCDKISKHKDFKDRPLEAMKGAFESVDAEFADKHALSAGWYEGSTALVAIVQGSQLLIGNVGDCRMVMVQEDNSVTELSVDHRPSNKVEQERIEAAGGRVSDGRVDGILSMSRSIGDKKLRSYVVATPDVSSHAISQKDQLLILASDGLWDVITSDELHGLVDGVHVQTAAERLVAESVLRGSKDNITVLIVDLRPDSVTMTMPKPVSARASNAFVQQAITSPRSKIASRARHAVSNTRSTILLPPPPSRFKSKRARMAEAAAAKLPARTSPSANPGQSLQSSSDAPSSVTETAAGKTPVAQKRPRGDRDN